MSRHARSPSVQPVLQGNSVTHSELPMKLPMSNEQTEPVTFHAFYFARQTHHILPTNLPTSAYTGSKPTIAGRLQKRSVARRTGRQLSPQRACHNSHCSHMTKDAFDC